jgi:saccharopine dehydrogenase-like NADP-dependent oxidoreductase
MRGLHTSAKNAGITVLNEVGVDPGIDHIYAIKKINEVHAQGGKVLEFHSYCGGLPAPDCADNPLALNSAGRRAAHYYLNETPHASSRTAT